MGDSLNGQQRDGPDRLGELAEKQASRYEGSESDRLWERDTYSPFKTDCIDIEHQGPVAGVEASNSGSAHALGSPAISSHRDGVQFSGSREK